MCTLAVLCLGFVALLFVQVTASMSGVVKSMDSALKSMNLEKVRVTPSSHQD